MLCHRGDSHGAVAKGHRGGGGQHNRPRAQADEAANQTPIRKPREAAAQPTIASVPAEPGTGSAEDARDTQAIWESQLSHEL